MQTVCALSLVAVAVTIQEEQAEREAAKMAECTFRPTLLARGRGSEAAVGGSHAEAPVLVRGLNRHLELQARPSISASLAACLW